MTKEQQIEEGLINKLVKDLKYIYRPDIRDWDSLRDNFLAKFQELNRVTLESNECIRLLEEIITPDIFAASKKLRELNTFIRNDGTPLNYTLIDISDWCKNSFEVVSQLRINTENSHHRYDVLLLINGLPLVHIELKGLTISPRRAMEQIVNYKTDPENGYTNKLLCFVQLFIVSNRNDTWYFANNNNRHFNFNADERFLPFYKFADVDNNKITDLDKFADVFLAKCALANMINRYMVLVASEQKLLMMRPYQIYAVRAIIDCINDNRGNGYIWHTTGSGKTLTSFKASTLLKSNPDIDKCVFVVDRKDLDKQTRDEFNRFQENCVEKNTNTDTLVDRLLSTDYADKVIVTTIQKLGIALSDNNSKDDDAKSKRTNKYKERLKKMKDSRVVFIFDECHRSQFGDNHKAIKNFFPNSQLFGFTGTPIFEKNASYKTVTGDTQTLMTTDDIFSKCLHAYTITNAIDDNNVLRFHASYFTPNTEVNRRKSEFATHEAVVKSILEKHDKLTANRKFNAVLATASINEAISYYHTIKEMQAELATTDPTFTPLNVACVFSPPAEGNKDIEQIQQDLLQEQEDNKVDPSGKKSALIQIIADYNKQYETNHDINEFDKYYQDIQQRIKEHKYSTGDVPHSKKIDITIVVDMLLTGFDSQYLNTLYLDKNLKYHGLIQAFSRTNRVLNDTKPYGNILDFRNQELAVNEAISLFSGKKCDAETAKTIWLVDPAPVVIEKYERAITALDTFMHSQGLTCAPADVANLKGDAAKGQFINLFKEVQRVKAQLDQYTDLTEEDIAEVEDLMPIDDLLGFRGVYLETAKQLRDKQDKPEYSDDKVQELDFEFVLFSSALIDYDYIMKLISEYTHATPENQQMTRDELIGLIASDAKFADEQDEIREYISQLAAGKGLDEKEIRSGYEIFKKNKLTKDTNKMARVHNLDAKSLQAFVDITMQRMVFDGDKLTDLFEHLDLGWKERANKEMALMAELAPLMRKLAKGRDISGLSAYEE